MEKGLSNTKEPPVLGRTLVYHQSESFPSTLNVKRELNCSTLSLGFPTWCHRMRMAIKVRYPLGHNWVGAISQKEINFLIILGKETLRPALRIAEFKATHFIGGTSTRSDGSGTTNSTKLGIPYLDLHPTNISLVTIDCMNLPPTHLSYSLHFLHETQPCLPPNPHNLNPCSSVVLDLLGWQSK